MSPFQMFLKVYSMTINVTAKCELERSTTKMKKKKQNSFLLIGINAFNFLFIFLFHINLDGIPFIIHPTLMKNQQFLPAPTMIKTERKKKLIFDCVNNDDT